MKHRVLVENEELRPYLPETHVLTESKLNEMIAQYDLLYVKPSVGGGGKGVIRLEQTDEYYVLQTIRRKVKFRKLKNMWIYLKKRIPPNRVYLVQQGLHLMRIDQRPIDFRVILIKPNRNAEWIYKGIIGKYAAKDSHITNRSSGGTSIRFFDALQQRFDYDEEQCVEKEETMTQLSYKIAQTLGDYFINMNQLGLDLAIDEEERVWLIEANTRPNYQLFRQHEKPEKFAQIRAHIRQLRTPTNRRNRRRGRQSSRKG